MTQISHISLNELLNAFPGGKNGETAVLIRRAYQFAKEAHGGERRLSGETYIEHDLAVANIMVGLYNYSPSTVVASLLHDVVAPHTGKTIENVRQAFGSEIAGLIEGLGKLYAYTEQRALQQENGYGKSQKALESMRQAIISIIEGDVRVVLIRMADCLQDLRKAGYLPPERQLEVANEAMHIYVPLANRLGVWQFKWELEDLAFRYLEPESYKEIATKLAARRVERARNVETAVNKLQARIKEEGYKGVVTGRPKHLYSIYRKMNRKNLDFEEIHDIQALRVVLEPDPAVDYDRMSLKEKDDVDRNLCYQVLGAVHSLWQPLPREFDDYIAAPKANGYRSLHTAVIDPTTGQKLEVQIRTVRMHTEAELGVAAHWAYKESDEAHVSIAFQKRIQNLRDLLSSLRDPDATLIDDEIFETEVAAERIYVFTPQGDVIDLPTGSTPIDFAYHVHSGLGHHCRGARVNGKMVSLDYRLRSGDRVEILKANRGGPSRDWMNPNLGYTGSARTRSKIRQWFRQQERAQNIEQGREMVERELRRLGLSDTYDTEDIARALKYDDVEQFLAKVGFGDIHSKQISGGIALLRQALKPDDDLQPLLEPPPKEPTGLKVLGLSNLPTKMAGCCNPIAPEPIIGYITRGRGVTIHRRNCNQVESLENERLIEVEWGETETYPIPVVVKAYRRPTLMDDIVGILQGQKIAVSRTKTATSRSILTIYLMVEVKDLDQLNWLLDKFEKLPNVIEAYRQRWS